MPDWGFSDAMSRPQVGARLFGRAAANAQLEQEDELGFMGHVGDIALAPLRGIEGAAQDTYGMVDWITGDALPDYKHRLLGESRTVAGGLIEGVSNFAAGFIPVAGVLGKVGKVGTVLDITRAAQSAAKTAGLAGKARAIAFGRNMAAGAVADFAVFDAHEARLSNLLESFPHLQNPVTEFLAANENDSEAFGRLKNALEGAALGGMVDAFAFGLRALKGQRKAIGEGMSPKATARFVRESGDPEAVQRSLYDEQQKIRDPENPAEVVGEVKVEPVPDDPQVLLKELLPDEEMVGRIHDDLVRMEETGYPAKTNPRRLSALDRLQLHLERNDLNLARFQGANGPARMVRAVEGLARSYGARELDELSPRSLERMAAESEDSLADILQAHESRDSLRAAIVKDVDTLREVATRTQAWETLLMGMAGTIKRSIDDGLKAPMDSASLLMGRAYEDVQWFTDMTAAMLGLQGEMGRGLAGFRNPIRSMLGEIRKMGEGPFKRAIDEQAAGVMKELGGVEKARKGLEKLRAVMDESGVAGLGKMTRAVGPEHGWQVLNEFWLNALLSGPRTTTINFVGPIITSIARPLERVIGGTLTGQSAEVASGFRQLFGLFRDSSEAFRLGRQAFAQRRNVLLPRNTVTEIRSGGRMVEAQAMLRAEVQGTRSPGALSPEVLGVSPDTFGGSLLRALDFLVPIPSAAIGATDEVVKQLNYRSVARDELTRDGLGMNLQGSDLAGYVESKMDVLLRDGQSYSLNRLRREGEQLAINEGLEGIEAVRRVRDYVQANFDERLSTISKLGEGRANEVTFTETLERGTLSRRVQDAVVAHPYMRLVAPFVRTPVNILKYAGRRADPYGPARFLVGKVFPATMPSIDKTRNLFLRQMLSGDASQKADAIGRITVGYGSLTTFFGLASAGKITGKGPDDRNRKAALMNAGWRPYSMRVGDRWVSYERLDPFASIIGAAADLYEYGQWSDASDQGTVETVLAATATALANQVTQKSYLTGLRNVLAVMTQPERRSEQFFEQFFGSLLAPSAGASFVESAGDPNMREVRSILDAVRNRIPGLSGSLEPRRNLLGEPIHRTRRLGDDELGSLMNVWMPVAYSEVSDDLVDRELAILNHGFGAPATKRGGIDLLEHRSRTGQTAFDRWQQLHGDVEVGGRTLRESLRKLFRSPKFRRLSPESTPDLDSPRIPLVETLIRRYRDKAFAQVLREYPQLGRQYQQLGIQKRRARAGRRPLSTTVSLGGYSSRLPALVTPQRLRTKEPR